MSAWLSPKPPVRNSITLVRCRCNVCGHVWIPRRPDPVECANKKCRSRKWNR